ncbi:helix-turn-helix domain-containing protein [Arenibacter lacus]|uniref:helix-turn-helix domain-containing protein n=1 Tax=Arenibacter lacus TaxID=2608629 RepID=UPI00168B8594|nr:helix-turn-helix transcriptional regulator [Arenibacter lacus]
MNELYTLTSIIDVAAFVKDARLALNISQETLSNLTGVERSWISRLERGRLEGMSLKTLEKLVQGLNSKLILVPTPALVG